MLTRARLIFHTLRYSRASQLYLRLWGAIKRRAGLGRLPQPPAGLRGSLTPAVAFLYHDPWNEPAQLLKGAFTFLNQSHRLGSPVDWQAGGLPLLWRFNLHYFNYLYLLEEAEQVALCRDWINNNPPKTGIGWLAFPTSQRIINWCKASFNDVELLNSLYLQAAHLYRHYEAHHPGNHLLENARALIFAGRFFAGQGEAAAWLEKGLAIYRRETPVQILADGGHFERSPMYHALVLAGYFDLINILPADDPDRSGLIEAARRMSDFLASVTKPDGQIALFNDATQEIAPPSAALLRYGNQLLPLAASQHAAFAETGYFIHASPEVYLIIDGGPIAPDFLPAHAHADIFSFELSIKGVPVIVDGGVFEYQAGEMRRWARSTRAHNTVCVDGQDQAECWGSFRVGRRFAPRAVSFEREGRQSRFSGRFDGYAKLIGDSITHERHITCNDDRRELIVEDEIDGEGEHLVESLIHLHPNIEVELDDSRARIKSPTIHCRVNSHGLPLNVEDSFYCPRFGLKQPSRTLSLRGKVNLPVKLVYSIHY